jgi:predicted esterase
MTRERREEEIADYVEYLDRTAGFVERELGCAARTRVVLGFSQGAATAWRWAALGDTRNERLIAAGGGIPPDLDLARAAERLSGTSIELVRGSRDAVFTSDALARDRERLAAAGLACSAREVDSGHELEASWLGRL